MKLKFEAPKLSRLYRYFDGFMIEDPRGYSWWWENEFGFWTIDWVKKVHFNVVAIEEDFDIKDKNFYALSVAKPCNTVRAFKRQVRKIKWYFPKGTKFILRSRYIGYDVTYTI